MPLTLGGLIDFSLGADVLGGATAAGLGDAAAGGLTADAAFGGAAADATAGGLLGTGAIDAAFGGAGVADALAGIDAAGGLTGFDAMGGGFGGFGKGGFGGAGGFGGDPATAAAAQTGDPTLSGPTNYAPGGGAAQTGQIGASTEWANPTQPSAMQGSLGSPFGQLSGPSPQMTDIMNAPMSPATANANPFGSLDTSLGPMQAGATPDFINSPPTAGFPAAPDAAAAPSVAAAPSAPAAAPAAASYGAPAASSAAAPSASSGLTATAANPSLSASIAGSPQAEADAATAAASGTQPAATAGQQANNLASAAKGIGAGGMMGQFMKMFQGLMQQAQGQQGGQLTPQQIQQLIQMLQQMGMGQGAGQQGVGGLYGFPGSGFGGGVGPWNRWGRGPWGWGRHGWRGHRPGAAGFENRMVDALAHGSGNPLALSQAGGISPGAASRISNTFNQMVQAYQQQSGQPVSDAVKQVLAGRAAAQAGYGGG